MLSTPIDTLYEKRSLYYDQMVVANLNKGCKSAKIEYEVYDVIKTFSATSSIVSKWFGQPGGGIQYKLPKAISVKELLEKEIIKKVFSIKKTDHFIF